MKRILKTGLLALALMVMVAGAALAGDKDGGWLGVFMQSIDYELAEAFELPVEYGVIINRVVDDSPAEKAGLKEEDIIIALNGKKITDSDDLVYVLEEMNEGDKIEVTVLRDGKEQKMSVVLGDKPDHDFEYFGSPRPPRAPRSFNLPHMFDNKMLGNLKDLQYIGSSSFIGVSLSSLTDQLGEYFGVKEGRGALITEVDKDSPAEKAGLKAGDVITAVAGKEVDDYEDIVRAIGKSKPGENVSITVIRDRNQKELSVEVGKRDRKSYSFYYNSDDDDDLLSLGNWSHWFDDHDRVNVDWDNNSSELKDLQRELEKMKEELEKVKKRLN